MAGRLLAEPRIILPALFLAERIEFEVTNWPLDYGDTALNSIHGSTIVLFGPRIAWFEDAPVRRSMWARKRSSPIGRPMFWRRADARTGWRVACLHQVDKAGEANGRLSAVSSKPTMPFATHYAKYFQNSLREEALTLQLP